jgi:hypothetical protein
MRLRLIWLLAAVALLADVFAVLVTTHQRREADRLSGLAATYRKKAEDLRIDEELHRDVAKLAKDNVIQCQQELDSIREDAERDRNRFPGDLKLLEKWRSLLAEAEELVADCQALANKQMSNMERAASLKRKYEHAASNPWENTQPDQPDSRPNPR